MAWTHTPAFLSSTPGGWRKTHQCGIITLNPLLLRRKLSKTGWIYIYIVKLSNGVLVGTTKFVIPCRSISVVPDDILIVNMRDTMTITTIATRIIRSRSNMSWNMWLHRIESIRICKPPSFWSLSSNLTSHRKKNDIVTRPNSCQQHRNEETQDVLNWWKKIGAILDSLQKSGPLLSTNSTKNTAGKPYVRNGLSGFPHVSYLVVFDHSVSELRANRSNFHETNVSSLKKGYPQRTFHLPTIDFQGLCHVNFSGG